MDKLKKLVRANIDVCHPLQYGFDEQRNLYHAPYPDGVKIVEAYNRCPNCEEWSPCETRKVAMED